MKLTPFEIETLRQQVQNSTLAELAAMHIILKNAPEHVVAQMAKTDRENGYTDYLARRRAIESVNILCAELNKLF